MKIELEIETSEDGEEDVKIVKKFGSSGHVIVSTGMIGKPVQVKEVKVKNKVKGGK